MKPTLPAKASRANAAQETWLELLTQDYSLDRIILILTLVLLTLKAAMAIGPAF